MSKEKLKPYLVVVIISIIFITVMSVGIFVIMSSWAQIEAKQFSEKAEILDNFGDLAAADIDIILQEDSAKYEAAYSSLNELAYLNDKYYAMINYNITHPNNYTQNDFDEIKIDFDLKMRLMINIVQSSEVYNYGLEQLNVDVTNNYTYLGHKYLYIINQWFQWDDQYETIHYDISNYVDGSFALTGDILDIPQIKLETWTYHLYNNLSILEFVGASKSISYITNYDDDIGLNLVNLSLTTVSEIQDSYVTLIEKTNNIIMDLNNTLITLALSGVLLAFATSFEHINLRRMSMIVGLVLIILAIVYFSSAIGTLVNLAQHEAEIIGHNEFVFI
ncbi:MAG: hypothetical protein ACTSO7_14270 [Candidatus Heimdallarchaeota archaeon]